MVNIQTWLQDYAEGRLIAPGANAQAIAQYAGVEEYNERVFPEPALIGELHLCAELLQKLSQCRTIFFIYGAMNIPLSVRIRIANVRYTSTDETGTVSLRIRLLDGETEILNLVSNSKNMVIDSQAEGEEITYRYSFGWNPQWLREKGYRPVIEVGDGLREEHLSACSLDLDNLFHKLGYVHPSFHFPDKFPGKKEESTSAPGQAETPEQEVSANEQPITTMKVIYISEPDPVTLTRSARVSLTLEGDVAHPAEINLQQVWDETLKALVGDEDLHGDSSAEFLRCIRRHYQPVQMEEGTWKMRRETIELSHNGRQISDGFTWRQDDPRAFEKEKSFSSIFDEIFATHVDLYRSVKGSDWVALLKAPMLMRTMIFTKPGSGDERFKLLNVREGEKPHRYGLFEMEMELLLTAKQLPATMVELLKAAGDRLKASPANQGLVRDIHATLSAIDPDFMELEPKGNTLINSYGTIPGYMPQ